MNALFAARRGGKAGYYLDWIIMTLIAVNVAAVALETVDSLYAQYSTFFYWFEADLNNAKTFRVAHFVRFPGCDLSRSNFP